MQRLGDKRAGYTAPGPEACPEFRSSDLESAPRWAADRPPAWFAGLRHRAWNTAQRQREAQLVVWTANGKLSFPIRNFSQPNPTLAQGKQASGQKHSDLSTAHLQQTGALWLSGGGLLTQGFLSPCSEALRDMISPRGENNHLPYFTCGATKLKRS